MINLKVFKITDPRNVKIGMKAIPTHLIKEKNNFVWIGKIFFIFDKGYEIVYDLKFNFKSINQIEYFSHRYKLNQLRFIIEDLNLVCKKNK